MSVKHVISVAAIAATLSACNQSGDITDPATIKRIDQVIAVGCPMADAIQASGLSLNDVQRRSLRTLSLICPPNLPPKNAYVVMADLVSAIVILQPLLTRRN